MAWRAVDDSGRLHSRRAAAHRNLRRHAPLYRVPHRGATVLSRELQAVGDSAEQSRSQPRRVLGEPSKLRAKSRRGDLAGASAPSNGVRSPANSLSNSRGGLHPGCRNGHTNRNRSCARRRWDGATSEGALCLGRHRSGRSAAPLRSGRHGLDGRGGEQSRDRRTGRARSRAAGLGAALHFSVRTGMVPGDGSDKRHHAAQRLCRTEGPAEIPHQTRRDHRPLFRPRTLVDLPACAGESELRRSPCAQ